jgi:hypothetical protein
MKDIYSTWATSYVVRIRAEDINGDYVLGDYSFSFLQA